MKKALSTILLISFSFSHAFAGLEIVRSNGITVTGADGITVTGADGITVTGADGFAAMRSNGITVTGADGVPISSADGVRTVGPNGAGFIGSNGFSAVRTNGITVTGADGITVTGADGITVTGADGTQYTADSLFFSRPNGITVTGADGLSAAGADGITVTGADGMPKRTPSGITVTGADGITVTGADGFSALTPDGITVTGADAVTGFGPDGVIFSKVAPSGITVTGADGITVTGADGITVTGADGLLFRGFGADLFPNIDDVPTGLQSVDPELAITLNNATDDSSVNAVVVFHNVVSDVELAQLRQIGIVGGTRFKALPMVYVTGTKRQIIAISQLPSVRSIYGNRTLTLNVDPYFKRTGITRVATDRDLTFRNGGMPVTGRNVTVAVLDTGINSLHADLSGKVVQNVRLADTQSAPVGFVEPAPVEGVPNSDVVAGHGTFVAGIIAGSGANSAGKFAGVAPNTRLLGLSTGDINLIHVLSGFDYILDKGTTYNVKVVNCSFSTNSLYDPNDPVNIASKLLTDRGVNVVFSAGNSGPGNATLNPYAMAPWVVSVGATDENGTIAPFSSRGVFGGIGQPTVVAPGVNVASLRSLATTTSVGGLPTDQPRLAAGELPYYTTASGTSFTAPQVAGAIALMLEANPSLSPKEVKEILAQTASPLPRYFAHEVGAGMLNTHAAVLEAAFPQRKIGIFRGSLLGNHTEFLTTTGAAFTQLLSPNLTATYGVPVGVNVVQAAFGITWGLGSANDYGLKVLDAAGSLAGESNSVNAPGLTGRHENVVVRNPAPQTFKMSIFNSLGVGTSQNVYGTVETTQARYCSMGDVSSLPTAQLSEIQKSITSNVMVGLGSRFRPSNAITRAELAAILVQSGVVPQYMTGNPAFNDVRDQTNRNAVESCQFGPNGRLFYDASTSGYFYPSEPATRLATAIALVKAAGLESSATAAALPAGVTDTAAIPSQWRGFVAVALQNGLLKLDSSGQFAPMRPLTRLEAATAFNRLIGN